MLEIDLYDEDVSLAETVNQLLSGMLPHENYDSKYFSPLLQGVFKFIHLDEMKMEHYVLFSALAQLRKLQSSVEGFEPVLTWDAVHLAIEPTMYDLVRKPELGMREWLSANSFSDNLDIDLNLETAVQKLYARTKELYEDCVAKAVPSKEALSALPALREAFIVNVVNGSLSIQKQILDRGKRVGRRTFAGPDGWRSYMKMTQAALNSRVDDADRGVVHVDSLEKVNEIMANLAALYESIGLYGITPLDDSTPLLKHRFVVVAANENVGKTLVAINLTGSLLAANKKVVYMHGETPESQIFSRILSNYIYHRHKVFITAYHIAGIYDMPEDKHRIVKMATAEIWGSGNLILKESFSYYDVENELYALHDEYQMDAVFFDHTKALSGGKKESEDIEAFAVGVREFKKHRPVFCCALSHLSFMAKELLERGKRVTTSPTRGSSTLSGEADEVLVLNRDQKMKEKGLVAIDVTKTRGTPINDIIIIKVLTDIASYEFDPRLQGSFDRNSVGMEAALQDIEHLHSDDDDDDGWADQGYEPA